MLYMLNHVSLSIWQFRYQHPRIPSWNIHNYTCLSKQPGMEAIERLHFLAPSTGEREGGEKTQPFNRFPSHRVIVKSEFQGHKMLLMLILLMIGKRRWRKKITSGSGLTRYIFSLMYGTVHACDTRDINEHTQNLCPIHSKEAMTPMTHPKTLGSPSSVWSRAERSFLPLSTPLKSSVSPRGQSETSALASVWSRPHKISCRSPVFNTRHGSF